MPNREPGYVNCYIDALIKKPLNNIQWPWHFSASRLFYEQPGYAIITEGFNDLSVDCMNTSFFLVSNKVNTQP